MNMKSMFDWSLDKHKKAEQAFGCSLHSLFEQLAGLFASCVASLSNICGYCAGTSACIYACKRFKAGSAAPTPKGCSACFVPVAGGFILTDHLFLMPARRPGVDTAPQRAFSPRAG